MNCPSIEATIKLASTFQYIKLENSAAVKNKVLHCFKFQVVINTAIIYGFVKVLQLELVEEVRLLFSESLLLEIKSFAVSIRSSFCDKALPLLPVHCSSTNEGFVKT
jgi:hypothetical protein